jgi:DNA polymerase-4
MIGEKTFQTLRSMGITTIELLSDIPPEMMERLMGKNGLMLWKKANGIDLTPVVPYSEQKSMSHETTFEQDTTNVSRMKDIISHMAEKLAFQLRKEEKLTSCITVKIRYSNFDTHTLQKQLPYTSLDHQLIATSLELFDRLYQRRMLIRLIGLRFSHLVNGVQQLDLFEDTPELINLCQAMDKIRLRYGPKAIRRANCFYSGNE